MCYHNLITWHACRHFVTVHEPCDKAARRSAAAAHAAASGSNRASGNPHAHIHPRFHCTSAHEPVATDIPAEHGLCPDEAKHPGVPDAARERHWARRLGTTETQGDGVSWARKVREALRQGERGGGGQGGGNR